MLARLVGIGYRAEALGKRKDPLWVGTLSRSDLLSCSQKAAWFIAFVCSKRRPRMVGGGGGGGGDRKTDSPYSVFSVTSVRRLVCLRAQTCPAWRVPFEGVEKRGRRTRRRKGGWGRRGQRYGCGNSGAAGCILECFNETSFEHKVMEVCETVWTFLTFTLEKDTLDTSHWNAGENRKKN